MVRMAYAPNPTISMSKEARGCLNATTKVPRAFPLKLNMGADCTDWMPRPRYRRRQPALKRVSIATSGQTTSFPHTRLCAGSDIGRRDRTVTERADERGWQAGKQSPVECSRATVDDGAAHDGAGLELFGQHAQCAYRFILGRIKVL